MAAQTTIDRSVPVILVSIAAPGQPAGTRLNLSDKVLSLTYEDDESKADKCSLTVDNFDLDNFDNPVWKKGAILEVTWGYPGHLAPIREVVIQKVTGFSQLKIEGYSRAILMHKDKKSRVFEGMSRSQVVTQIAEEQGFTGENQQIEDTVDVLETVTQARETDAEFVRRLAKQEGFEFYIDFDGFHFHPRLLNQKPLRVYWHYNDPGRGDLMNVSIENDVTRVPGRVKVKGRNPKTKEDISEAGSNTETNRSGLASEVEAKSFSDQTTILSVETEDIDVVDTTTVSPSAPEGDTSETTVGLGNASTAAGAKRQADGAYRKAVLATVQLSCTVRGDPSLLAKTVFELRGTGKRLSGNYYIKSVIHSVSAGNFTCGLKARSDGHNGYASSASGKSGIQPKSTPSNAEVNSQNANGATPDTATMFATPSREDEGVEFGFKDTRGRAIAGPNSKFNIPE